MKVLFVIPAEAGIQAAFSGFPLKTCGNDGRVTQLTFMFRCDQRVMTVRRNDGELLFRKIEKAPVDFLMMQLQFR